jgi:hypothetical protein
MLSRQHDTIMIWCWRGSSSANEAMKEGGLKSVTKLAITAILLIFTLPGLAGAQDSVAKSPQTARQTKAPVIYKNKRYRFTLDLPKSWKGYSVLVSEWTANVQDPANPDKDPREVRGPLITIRHPGWTEANPRQDIPLMVLTYAQANLSDEGNLFASAAGYPPPEIGRNARYVFAVPPRYNSQDLPGLDEVDAILRQKSLHPY